MRIVTWNVRFQELESRLGDVVSALAESGADIIALQEVTVGLVDATAELLAGVGFPHSINSITAAKPGQWGLKPFASMIASKWLLRPGPNDWRLQAPFPESFARAIVQTPTGPVDMLSVHVPNGALAGWKKVHSLRVLEDTLKGKSDLPRVVAGDFNEPKELLASGEIVTFSDIDPGDKPLGHRLWTDSDGQTGDLFEWEDAVQAVLGPRPTHDLRDAHTTLYGGMFTPTTHMFAGRYPRWFDHVLVSPELPVRGCGVFSEWRDAKLSDHAGVWADIG